MASDSELIKWSLAGDTAAFVEVVDRHEAAVWAYLVRRAGRQAAEDLLGEVWTAAFAARRTYDLSFPVARPWLFGVALNTLRRHWRSQPVGDPRADLADLAGRSVMSDPWPSADERIHGEAVLRRALDQLPADEREVLFLVVWEELTVADAARSLGIPAGTARRYLHQARVALRDTPGMVALLDQYNTVSESK
ncbi:MAG TPA: sigma-70 family RNA polymerase sigma factor [Acidimicrobiales bacterium]|nr:sigma-70 family RNA polymerase sigma factor [Acidimicrobiales bacterium]